MILQFESFLSTSFILTMRNVNLNLPSSSPSKALFYINYEECKSITTNNSHNTISSFILTMRNVNIQTIKK